MLRVPGPLARLHPGLRPVGLRWVEGGGLLARAMLREAVGLGRAGGDPCLRPRAEGWLAHGVQRRAGQGAGV
eukprot:1929194-Lingulodinium_polyedra.AAC.1